VATDELAIAPPAPSEAEISTIVRRLAAAYAANIGWRMQELQENAEEADRRLRALHDPEKQRQLMDEPVDQISWWSLSPLIEVDPKAGWAAWERVKTEALEELESGHRAALALCWDDSPWQRAQFLAIRQTFIGEWQPRGGIELTLIDQMAQAHSLYLHWIERAHMQASLEASSFDKQISQNGRWKPRQISAAESLDQSAQMAERWQKLFVRALRALRDFRRHAPSVVLAGAGSQVNLGVVQSNTTGATQKV
jgi:hypothetical protein